jgi:hypothetical protein
MWLVAIILHSKGKVNKVRISGESSHQRNHLCHGFLEGKYKTCVRDKEIQHWAQWKWEEGDSLTKPHLKAMLTGFVFVWKTCKLAEF